jgi:hypothetical protein
MEDRPLLPPGDVSWWVYSVRWKSMEVSRDKQ